MLELTTNTRAGIGVNVLSFINAKKSGKCPDRAPTKNNLENKFNITVQLLNFDIALLQNTAFQTTSNSYYLKRSLSVSVLWLTFVVQMSYLKMTLKQQLLGTFLHQTTAFGTKQRLVAFLFWIKLEVVWSWTWCFTRAHGLGLEQIAQHYQFMIMTQLTVMR